MGPKRGRAKTAGNRSRPTKASGAATASTPSDERRSTSSPPPVEESDLVQNTGCRQVRATRGRNIVANQEKVAEPGPEMMDEGSVEQEEIAVIEGDHSGSKNDRKLPSGVKLKQARLAELSQKPGAITLATEDSCDECRSGGYQCIVLSHLRREHRRCEGCSATACSFLRTDRPLRGLSILSKLQATASSLANHPQLASPHRSTASSLHEHLVKLGEPSGEQEVDEEEASGDESTETDEGDEEEVGTPES